MTSPSEQSTNPKDKIGRTKPPLHLIPAPAMVQEAVVFGLGAEKYGPYNWRQHSVSASVYVAAALRHLMQWNDGEDIDTESGASHLAHARACLGILLDAECQDKLVDDRPEPGGASVLIQHFTTPSGSGGVRQEIENRLDKSVETGYNEAPQATPPETPQEERLVRQQLTPELAEKAALREFLTDHGCLPSTAAEIASGLSVPRHIDPALEPHKVYVAGPMRGYEKFNFPAFDEARDRFLGLGWHVISPADIDRASGVNEDDPEEGADSKQATFVRRDFFALYSLKRGRDAIAVLPGWEDSTGASAEVHLARWLGLKVLDAQTGNLLRMSQGNDLTFAMDEYLEKQ